MSADIVEARKLYADFRKSPKTHLVQTTEIATACECQHLYKMSNLYGVFRGDKDYLIGNTVHDILSLILDGPIIENWQFGVKDYKSLATKIMDESSSIIEETATYVKEIAKKEDREIPEDFDERVSELTKHLIESITKRIMKKYHQPKRAVTEITISNIQNHQEGRIDAILEYSNGYALLDWKTHSIDKNNIGMYEKWQLFSNLLLANYRYTGSEENWDKYLFSSIAHYSGAYFPKYETIMKENEKILSNRQFAFNVLCGEKVQAEKPKFCPVCDTNSEGSKECKFYREDLKLAYEGNLPAQYDKMRRQLFGKRYEILKGKAGVNLHKYVFSYLSRKYDDKIALQKLEKLGIIDTHYRYGYHDKEDVYFIRNNFDDSFLEPRKIIRIIGKEDDIPLLACISEHASIIKVLDNSIVLNFRSKTALERAKKQLFHLPLIIFSDQINLTKRMLVPIHEFHKLAADIFIHKDEDTHQ